MPPATRRRYWYHYHELRIPDWLLRQVGIEAGDRVEVSVVEGCLVAVPVGKAKVSAATGSDKASEGTGRPRAA